MSSSLRRQALAKGVSGGLPPIPDGHTLPSLPKHHPPSARDYTPLPWSDYFEEKRTLTVNETDAFCAYLTGDCSGPLFVLLHGGGYSGLTWACFAKELIELIHCRVLAIDQRGHGETVTSDDADLSIDILANDVKHVVQSFLNADSGEGAEETQGIVLLGHSMGGAVAVHASELLSGCANDPKQVLGLVVIDVVEGSAMDALYSMQSFLRSRPTEFESIQQGIEWCMRSGQTKNLEAARVSFPSQLREVVKTTEREDQGVGGENVSTTEGKKKIEAIPEDSEVEEYSATTDTESAPKKLKQSITKLTWRIDLTKTEHFWKGWFAGMSARFLSVPAPKTLILAGVDRLDKDLTVGQMQGKFQMIVLPRVGHAVQEDSPGRVAEAMATFCVRHQLTTAKKEFQMVFPGC